MSDSGTKVLVLATSKSDDSRSRRAGRLAASHLETLGITVDFWDARGLGYEFEEVDLDEIRRRFASAHGLLLCFPIHDWGACPFTRQLLIKAFSDNLQPFRPTGLIAGGGGPRSYLAYGDLALMLTAETNATIVGGAVHAAGDLIDPVGGDISNDLRDRVIHLAEALAAYAGR